MLSNKEHQVLIRIHRTTNLTLRPLTMLDNGDHQEREIKLLAGYYSNKV